MTSASCRLAPCVFVLLSLVGACSVGPAQGRDAGSARDLGSAADGSSAANDARADAEPSAQDLGRADTGPRDAGPSPDLGAPSCDGSQVALPFPSETPGASRTEPPSCPSCPAFEGVVATPRDTTANVVGGTSDAATECRYYLQSPTCGGTSGAFLPNELRSFSLVLPLFCGRNLLQLVCESAAGRSVYTTELAGPQCASRDVQVTLAWGATARDMELHLVREGARINDTVGDCTWFTCMSTSPDWGTPGDPTDDPRKDVDNTSTFGPENIFLTRAPDGRYDVLVEYWGSGTQDTSEVTITLGGRTVWRGSRAMDVHDVWHVGTLRFPASTFTPVDTIIPCTAAWQTGGSRGCALAIP